MKNLPNPQQHHLVHLLGSDALIHTLLGSRPAKNAPSLQSCLLGPPAAQEMSGEKEAACPKHLVWLCQVQEHCWPPHCWVGGNLPHSFCSTSNTVGLPESAVPPGSCKFLWCFFNAFTPLHQSDPERQWILAKRGTENTKAVIVFYFVFKWCYVVHVVLQEMCPNICNSFCHTPSFAVLQKNSAGRRSSLDPHLQGTNLQLRHETGVTVQPRAAEDYFRQSSTSPCQPAWCYLPCRGD